VGSDWSLAYRVSQGLTVASTAASAISLTPAPPENVSPRSNLTTDPRSDAASRLGWLRDRSELRSPFGKGCCPSHRRGGLVDGRKARACERAGVSPYTSSSEFAEACVFVKQSPPPGLCHFSLVAQREVLLIPKLRRQIAEFLQHSSLQRLGMLYQSTSVGLGYGLRGGYFLELLRGLQNPVTADNIRNSSPPAGPGLLTWFPSTTPFGLALGAG